MSTFPLLTIQNSPTCAGLLKEPQKFQIQFLELHVNFSIVDNAELLARARVGLLHIVHNAEGDPRAGGSPEIPSVTLKVLRLKALRP